MSGAGARLGCMSDLRCCSRCGLDGTAVEFPIGGLRCLDCRRAVVRAHYSANPGYYKAKARQRQKRVIAQARLWLMAYLATHPCVDCGVRDRRVLEFDHRDDAVKRAPVATLARSGYPLRAVQVEVAKCDVRCANCHRIRTHRQQGWWGATLDAG